MAFAAGGAAFQRYRGSQQNIAFLSGASFRDDFKILPKRSRRAGAYSQWAAGQTRLSQHVSLKAVLLTKAHKLQVFRGVVFVP